MNIQATQIRTEGNIIYIKADPAIGILTLTSFTDNATGESGGIQFKREFRYSSNGVTWTDWQALTTPAITSISVQTTDTLVIELKYTKIQPTGTDVLAVSSATIGVTETTFTEGYYFENSIFSEFFQSNDVNVLRWYVAVLEKLYERGLIPSFINRLNSDGLPDDFVDFWKSIARFFAYLVVYARSYQDFYTNTYLTAEYLEEKGLKTSVNNTLTELNYLMNTFHSQIFNRGTLHIIDQKANGAPVDGELLRLIYYVTTDEFLFNLYKPEHFGWNLNNSSPLHKGLYLNDNINKSYETGTQITDLIKYPTTGTVSIVTDAGNSTMYINGAGGISSTGGNKYIKIDPNLDYEISFIIKKSAGQTLNFGLSGYDSSHNPVNFTSQATGVTSNWFLQNAPLVRNDKYILVRAFIYNYTVSFSTGATLSLNQGNNLISPSNVCYIIPNITISSGTANIYAIRVLPMQTVYSRGFIQTSNFISCWLKNNNAHKSIRQVRDYITKYLIPYNAEIVLSRIGDNLYQPARETIANYWLPSGEACETTIWVGTDEACEPQYSWVVDTPYCLQD